MNPSTAPSTSVSAAPATEAVFPGLEVARPGYREIHLSGLPRRALESDAELTAFFEALALRLSECRASVLQEKVYGPADQHGRLEALREEAWRRCGLDPDSPRLFVEGRPCGGGACAGVQIVAAGGAPLRDVRRDGRCVGRLLETPEARALWVSDLQGGRGDVASQTRHLFQGAFDLLQAHGFAPTSLVRTWIYNARILDWYGEFNRARTAVFAERGLSGPLPASTGIQGRGPAGSETMMDLLAVDPRTWRVHPMTNRRQNEAPNYGSAFSRGMVLDPGERKLLLLSGTASIDRLGRTVRFDDPMGQVLETLMNVASLLESEGAGLEDLVSATLFCKNEAVWAAWQEAVRLLCLPVLPIVPVFADVCRHELLVEIEGMAIAR